MAVCLIDSVMGPLGFYNICLKVDDLDGTVAFYRGLGFEPTGEDAPGLRVSLANGADALTFMTFLDADLINFRGAHIHRLMCEIEAAGMAVTGYNAIPEEQPLMLDETGEPLPENECGHFTVHDPDGHELFFNTHPPERAPFESAMAAGRNNGDRASRRLLGRLIYGLDVTDLNASGVFYETLGLEVVRDADDAWVTPPARHRAAHFVLRLRQSDRAGSLLRFYGPTAGESAMRAWGFTKDGTKWLGNDPDGHPLEILPNQSLPDVWML
ncbi:MAG: VOC family protein [Gammaproteobacteria bacterium]|nr:VOC family protein [Gammaproteobacteria bacterium]